MQPLVIQIERTEEHKADTCAFAQSPVRIGRNQLNDLQLDESFVSQWHGVIRFDDKQTTYLDLGSTNPTLVDGKAIARNVETVISETTDLRIGSLRLHLFRVEAPLELFGARRKTAFARTGSPSEGAIANTMFLRDDMTPMIGGGRSASEVFKAEVAKASQPSFSMVAGPRPVMHSADAQAAQRYVAPSPVGKSAANPSLMASYEAYRSSFESFLASVRAELEQAPSAERDSRLDRLIGIFPELAREPEFRALLDKLGISPLRTGVPEMEDWLYRLTDGLFPPPGVAINVALAMERMGEVLEVFSTAFVELRNAHSSFCEEMALEKSDLDSILHTTENPRALLAYLLNPGKEGSVKVTELSRAMADFAVHQVALVSAVVQGARDVLDELAPDTLMKNTEPAAAPGLFAKMFSSDNKGKLWQRYVSVFSEATDEDRFTRKLFGRGFARKYYAITGGRRSLPPPGPSR